MPSLEDIGRAELARRRKISAAKKGRPLSKGHRDAISRAMRRYDEKVKRALAAYEKAGSDE